MTDYHVCRYLVTIKFRLLRICAYEGGITLKGGLDGSIHGDDPYSGRVEVCHDGLLKSICDDGQPILSDPDLLVEHTGRIKCNQLGCAQCDRFTKNGAIGGIVTDATSGEFWLSYQICGGTETRIGCSHDGFGNAMCSAGESVSVVCSDFIGEIVGCVAKTCT